MRREPLDLYDIQVQRLILPLHYPSSAAVFDPPLFRPVPATSIEAHLSRPMADTPHSTSMDDPNALLPRVTITYCTQCKWMLRAAYFGQELLSTFGTALSEVALRPSTGGVFTVQVTAYQEPADQESAATAGGAASREIVQKGLWDRKVDGGFPGTLRPLVAFNLLDGETTCCLLPEKTAVFIPLQAESEISGANSSALT